MPAERAELMRCVICGEKIRYGDRICNACYDAMRLGRPVKKR